MVAPCPPLETVGLADLFLGRPRSRRYPKFNIRRDIPRQDTGIEGRVRGHEEKIHADGLADPVRDAADLVPDLTGFVTKTFSVPPTAWPGPDLGSRSRPALGHSLLPRPRY